MHLSISQILIFIAAIVFASTKTSSTDQSPDYLWKRLVNMPTSVFESVFLPNYIDFHGDILQSEALSDDCKSDLYSALTALRLRQTWAVKLFNSWAKFPPPGLSRGTLTDFGDYDQCLGADVGAVVPQYCLLDIAAPMPYKVFIFSGETKML